MSSETRSLYPLTVDCVIFGYDKGLLNIALIQRKKDPFKGMWAIPGGFMEGDETAEETALRELKEETGLENIFLEQFHTFSSHGRDPRGRTITIAFFALINSEKYLLTASSDASKAKWWPAYKIPPLAFEQKEMYEMALQRLRLAMKTRPLAFELLSKMFTLTQLQNLYEQVFNIQIDTRNFRRKVKKMTFIAPTDQKQEGKQHRPALLYRYDSKIYKEFLEENLF